MLNSSRFPDSYIYTHLFVDLCTFSPYTGLSTVSWEVIAEKLSVRQRGDISAHWWTTGKFCVAATCKTWVLSWLLEIYAGVICLCTLFCVLIDCCVLDWSCDSGHLLFWCQPARALGCLQKCYEKCWGTSNILETNRKRYFRSWRFMTNHYWNT